MDSRDNFLGKFKDFIDTIDEEYLIGITNKGIVNRAKKDLDKADNIELKVLDNRIDFNIDNIECSIYGDIKNYKCSCPSRSMCKHIVMSYLYIMNNKKCFFKSEDNSCDIAEDIKDNAHFLNEVSDFNKAEENACGKKEFKNLKEYSIKDIKKAIGERNLFTIIKRIEFGINYEITETALITVNFVDENIVVKLLDNLDNCVCSCKKKEMCRHKAEAIILYKLKKGYLTLEELNSYDKSLSLINEEDGKKACREIKNVMEEIFISGLSRLSPTILDKLNNSAVICHNYGIPNFEKNIRDIREEINLYFKKNASFDSVRLLNKVTRLYMNAVRIEKTDDIKKLADIIGEFKSSYYEIPAVQLYGVGAEAWETKSGYEGITYYFYENHKKQFFTYTKAAPVFYDNYTKKDYMSSSLKAPWNLNCTCEQLSSCHFKLVYGKINCKGRISSSSESYGFVVDETDIRSLSLEKHFFNQWKNLIEVLKRKKYSDDTYNLVFIEGKAFGESSFDNINQTFKAEIYDINNKIMNINISFSLRTKKMIRILEKMIKINKMPIFLGRVYLSHGKIMFYPVSYFIEGKPHNLT